MEEDIEILESLLEDGFSAMCPTEAEALENLIKRYQLLEHRLEVADEFVEIRKKNMIPEHYDDLKYIINECDLNSSW